MANYNWVIEHSSNSGSTWTTITTYVQSWNYRYGRQSVTDQWSAGGGLMTGVYPASLPTISVGDWIRFKDGTAAKYILAVADYRRIYNPKGATADAWEIALEDAYAQIGRGRTSTDQTFTDGIDINAVVNLGFAYAGITAAEYGGTTNKVSQFTFKASEFIVDKINRLNAQAGAYVRGHDVSTGLYWFAVDALPWNGPGIGPGPGTFSETTWSDDGTAGDFEYQQIEFEGLAESYFDEVYVTPTGLTTQVAGTGTRTYGIDTYNYTTTAALDWANYLLIQLGDKTLTPRRLVSSSAAQTDGLPDVLKLLPANTIKLQLRGSDYYAIIEGGQISAVPGNTLITINLSDRDAVNYLLLNDAYWGRLNFNRLGFS